MSGSPRTVHRTEAMFGAGDVAQWMPGVGERRNWRANLRYEPHRAVITVHGDEQAAASELARLVTIVRGLGTASIDVYLPLRRRS